jgi:hypothetical protein
MTDNLPRQICLIYFNYSVLNHHEHKPTEATQIRGKATRKKKGMLITEGPISLY